MTRVGPRVNTAASYSDVQPQLDPLFPPAPAVRAPVGAQRPDQVGHVTALRGPQSPEGLAGLTRVGSAGSDPASGANSRCSLSTGTSAAGVAKRELVGASWSDYKFLSCARTTAFPPGWPPQDRLVCSVRLDHRNEARPGDSYQPCRGPVGGPSSSWHHSTPQRDPRALQTRHGRGDYTNAALPEP